MGVWGRSHQVILSLAVKTGKFWAAGNFTNLQENTATLNKMAEIVVSLQSENQDIKRLAKYECSKMNLSQDITIGQIESEIKWLQNQLDNKIEEYENAVRKLEELVKILNKRYLSKIEKILDEL